MIILMVLSRLYDVTEGTIMSPAHLLSLILPRTSPHAQETIMPEIPVLHASSGQIKRYPICLKGFWDSGIVLARKIVYQGDSVILDFLHSIGTEKLADILKA